MFNAPPIAGKLPVENSEKWEEYLISDFTGGLNTADPSVALRKEQFSAMLNWYLLPNRSLKVRGPFRPWLVASEDTVFPDSAPPLSFFIVELSGTDYRLGCWDNGSNTEVSVYDESNNRWAGEVAGTTTKANLTDGYPVRFVKYSVNDAEDVIFCNGKDTPQRIAQSGGTIVDQASTDLGLTAPGAPSTLAEASTAVTDEQGIQYDGQYYYKFTAWYDSSGTNTKYGESGPSAVSAAMTVDGADISANTRVSSALTNCPAIPSGATRNYVYRSPPEEINGPFKRVGYYSSGTSYTDKTPVGEEGVEVPADAGTPPKLKNPLVHDGRLWGIGINASGALNNKGVWSRKGSPDFFVTLEFAYFPDPLIGPYAFKKDLYWFTEKQIYVVPNSDVETYSKPLKVCDIGCDSWDSITDVGNGLVWQYQGNIYWANFNDFNPETGDLPWPIGDPIKNKIENIPTAQRADSNAVLHKDRYYISITGPNQTVPTTTLVWDVKHGTRLLQQGLTGGWSSLDWATNFMQSFDGTLYTADNTNKYIMEHDFAGTADFTSKTNYDASTSVNIPTELATGDLFFGNEWSNKIINSLSLMTKTSGITLNAVISFNDGEYERTKSFSLGSGSLAVDSTWLVWGEGTWNNFNWGESAFGIQSDHKKTGKGGKGRNAKLTLVSTDSEDTNLIMAKLYYKALPSPA